MGIPAIIESKNPDGGIKIPKKYTFDHFGSCENFIFFLFGAQSPLGKNANCGYVRHYMEYFVFIECKNL